jgi:hypothetical protein
LPLRRGRGARCRDLDARPLKLRSLAAGTDVISVSFIVAGQWINRGRTGAPAQTQAAPHWPDHCPKRAKLDHKIKKGKDLHRSDYR